MESGKQNHRIEMTRDPEIEGTPRFVGETDDGQRVIIAMALTDWEALGEPGELVLRIRPSG